LEGQETSVEKQAPLLERIHALLRQFRVRFPGQDFYKSIVKEVGHRLDFVRGNSRSRRDGKRATPRRK